MKCFNPSERKWLAALILLAFVPLAVSRLKQPAASEIIFHWGWNEFQAEAKSKIPIGSDIRTAKAFLNRNGCSCSVLTDGKFHLNRTLEEAAKKSKKMASIECYHEESRYFILSRRWMIFADFLNGKVVSVSTSTYSTADDL